MPLPVSVKVAILGLPGQLDIGDAATIEFILNQLEHAGELRKQQNTSAFVEQFREHFEKKFELRRFHGFAFTHRAMQLDQARVAAGLTQLQQRVENHDLTLRHAAAVKYLTQFFVKGQAQRFVKIALRTRQFYPADDFGFRWQIVEHLLLGSSQQEGPHALGQQTAALDITLLFHR